MDDETNPGNTENTDDNVQELYVTITLPLSVVEELLGAFAQKNKTSGKRLALELAKRKAAMDAQMPVPEVTAASIENTEAAALPAAANNKLARFETTLNGAFPAFDITRKDTTPPSTF